MSEEPTEFEKAEFDSIARELREDTYTPLEGASPLGQRARAFFIAAMLLDTQPGLRKPVSFFTQSIISTHGYRSLRSCSPLTRSSLH